MSCGRSWVTESEFLYTLLTLISANTECSPVPPIFHPEYGRFMLESTPGAPYTGSVSDLLSVESNMRYR